MQFEIKFKSIAVRWFLNIFLIVVLAVCTVAVAFSAVFTNLYTERIKNLASDYAYEFSALSNTNTSTFKDTAINIASEFEYKEKIEVQVIDNNGEVIVSTTGFQSTTDEMPDYLKAKESGKDTVIKSQTADGEGIMSGTTMLVDSEGQNLGA